MLRPILPLMLSLGLLTAGSAAATVIADSRLEFSSVQGQDNWHYGNFNRSLDGDGLYASGEFSPFDQYVAARQVWRRSQDDTEGDISGIYLELNEHGGHPSGLGPDAAQIHEIWAVRRYVAEQAGNFWLEFTLNKDNLNPNAGGITGHIFLNGLELFSRFIATDDGVGVSLVLPISLNPGDFLDFAIDPTGLATPRDNFRSGRSDGSNFFMRVHDALPVPEPVGLSGLGLGAIALLRRRRQSANRA